MKTEEEHRLEQRRTMRAFQHLLTQEAIANAHQALVSDGRTPSEAADDLKILHQKGIAIVRDDLDMSRTLTGVSIFVGLLFFIGGVTSGDPTIWYSFSTLSFVLAILQFRKLHVQSKNIDNREAVFAELLSRLRAGSVSTERSEHDDGVHVDVESDV